MSGNHMTELLAEDGKMLERADRLKAPPVVGKYYLVPALLWARNYCAGGRDPAKVLNSIQSSRYARWWPVWGRKHNDIEFFNFPGKHYHIDPRFLTKKQWTEFSDWPERTPLQRLQGHPLSHTDLPDGPPRTTLRRMRCTMAHAQWGHDDKAAPIALNESFKGQQCAKGKRGFVCPHQLFPIGSVREIDGVITCPLHGLRIDAKSGVCVGSEPRP